MDVANGIAAVPEHVTQTLAWIEERIAGLWSARSELMRAFNIAEPEPGNGPAPGERPALPARTPRVNGKSSERTAAAMRIRDHLAKAGPLRTGDLAEQTGLNVCTVGIACKKSPWFEKAGNQFSPWQLTEAGRASLNDVEASM